MKPTASATGTPSARRTPNRPSSANTTSAPPKDTGRKARRAEAVSELVNYITIPLAVKAAQDEARLEENQISPFALDLYVIGQSKDQLASAIVDVAEEYPVLGVVLDKLGVAGPVGALVMTVATIGMQIAENHQRLSPQMTQSLPVIPAQDLAQAIRSEVKRPKQTQEKAADNGSTD